MHNRDRDSVRARLERIENGGTAFLPLAENYGLRPIEPLDGAKTGDICCCWSTRIAGLDLEQNNFEQIASLRTGRTSEVLSNGDEIHDAG